MMVATRLFSQALSRQDRVIAVSGTPAPVYGGAGAAPVPVAVVPIPARSLAPDSLLRIWALFDFPPPVHAGRAVFCEIAGQAVFQTFPNAGVGGLQVEHFASVAPDLKSLSVFGQFANDALSPAPGGGAPLSAHAASKAVLAVDLTVDQTLTLSVQPVNGDVAELTAFCVENLCAAAVPAVSRQPANAIACWGDSLTSGVGSATGGWPAALRVLRPGQIVVNLGIGGLTSGQIAALARGDAVRGRLWNAVFAMGRNDVGAADLTGLVTGNLAAAVANLAPGAKVIVCTLLPAAGEPPGSGNWNAIVALNAALRATYGTRVADVFAALTANGTAPVPIADRAVAASTSATLASGSTAATVASAAGLASGQFLAGAGIPDQTTITAVSGTTLTLSAPATASGSGVPVSAVAANEGHLNDSGYAVWAATVEAALAANGL